MLICSILHNCLYIFFSCHFYILVGMNDIEWLVDAPGFQFLINNKRCDGDDTIFLMIFVHSAPTNFRKRQVIR